MNGTRCASRKRSKLPPAARGADARARASRPPFRLRPIPGPSPLRAQANPEVADHAELRGISATGECLSVKEPLVERLYSEASTHRGPMAAMSPVDAAPDDDAAAGAEPAPPRPGRTA